MENKIYSQIDLNAYIARYVDEMGCSLQEACEALDIDYSTVYSNAAEME